MSSILELVRARLVAFAGLSALVGTRVYASALPPNVTLPALTFHKVSSPRVHTMGGDPGLANPRLQLTAWGATPLAAEQVREQVRLALQDWASGDVLTSLVDTDTGPIQHPGTGRYMATQDVRCWHQEVLP